MKFASDLMSVISLIVSVVLTISLFIIARMISKKSDKQNKQYYTVSWANDLFYRIDKAIAKKIEIEGTIVPAQTLEYISNNKPIESLVFVILNQYSALGRAVKDDLVDIESIRNLRGNAIVQTWDFYKAYILEYRKKIDNVSWTDFEYLHKIISRNEI